MNRQDLEALPTEILDDIVGFLPTLSILSLRRASSIFATRSPRTQRFYRDQHLGGRLVTYLWDLDIESCRATQECVPKGANVDDYWDWRQLAGYLSDAKGIVECGPDQSDILLGF